MASSKFENVRHIATVANDPYFFHKKLIRDSEVSTLAGLHSEAVLISRIRDLLGRTDSESVVEIYAHLGAVALLNSRSAVDALKSMDLDYLHWGKELVRFIANSFEPSAFTSVTGEGIISSSSKTARSTGPLVVNAGAGTLYRSDRTESAFKKVN